MDTFDTHASDATDAATAPLFTPPAAATAEPARFAPEPLRPRIRLAAVIWGIVLGTIAVGALSVVLDPARGAAVTDWLVGLTPLSAWAIAILAIGGLLLVTGLVGLVRRSQRPAEASRT